MKEYIIKLAGTDGNTKFKMKLTESEAEIIRKVALKAEETIQKEDKFLSQFMPRLEIFEV